MPIISFVILSWNVKEYLENCLSSITLYCQIEHEIIIVDNASTDNSVTYIKNKFPSVIIIANKENKGFAKANNQGFSIAKGEFIFILNPDTLLYQNTVEGLLNTIRKSDKENIIAVGPKTYNHDGTIQKTCARIPNSLSSTLLLECFRMYKIPFIGKFIETKLLYPYSYDKVLSVKAISGSAILIRAQSLKKIGGFYPSYLHCGEDLELCYRITKIGQLIYTPEAEIIHFGGKSSEQEYDRVTENAILSLHLYFKRCKNTLYGLIYKIIILFLGAPLSIIILTFKSILSNKSGQNVLHVQVQNYIRLFKNPLWHII